MNKQIEEMLEDLSKVCYEKTCDDRINKIKNYINKLETQTEIPDGVVVITTDILHEIKNDVWMEAWEESEKHTAREILREYRELIRNIGTFATEKAFKKWIEEKYGVEKNEVER